jgi:hypothetical protein
VLAAIALHTCAYVAACSDSGNERRAPAREGHVSSSTSGRLHCAGRFAFVAPEEMRDTGRTQSIYGTNVSVIPVVPGGVDAYWKSRLAQIGAVQPRRFDFQPDVRSAWYIGSSTSPSLLTLEMVKPVDAGLLHVSRAANSGKEHLAESLAKDIVSAYVARTDRGFCLGSGAITLEPSQYEQARLVLASTVSPDIDIEIATRTVGEPDVTTYSNVDEETEVASSGGGTLTVLRNAQRSAAGLSGKEIWISVSAPDEMPMLRFTWHYPGIGGSSTEPSINIVGSAPQLKRAHLEAIWNSVLTSLRAIPLAPAEAK